MNNFAKKLDSYFEISKRNSNIKTELIAGVTTFFAMCYIIMVNPSSILGDANAPEIWNAIYIGTILSAIVGTMLMALYAKMPYAQAPGMGLNSFFFVSFILPALLTSSNLVLAYGKGLAVIFISGIVFLLLSITGARKTIAKALPDCLKKSIPAGIGLFIAFIGLKNSGLVVANQFTFVSFADMTSWAAAAPIIAAFLGLMIIAVLRKRKVKGDIFIGILSSTVLFYLLTWTAPAVKWDDAFGAFGDFGKVGLFNINFAELFKGADFMAILNIIMLVITFCLIDMFDTMGTLYGAASQAKMLDKDGNPINLDKCMTCDATATLAGSLMGTSTVTTYVESAAGISAGGRTGLTSVMVSILFLLALFISPIVKIIPAVATAPALIFVGVLMISSIKEVDLSDMSSAVPAFLTLIMMPLTYSIANGIAIGMISYVLIKVFTGKFKDINIVLLILAILFALRFALVKM